MLKSPRKCISSAVDAAFSIWRETRLLELSGLYTELIRKGFVFYFKLISSQIDSISEDSRSFRRLYLKWSAIYTTTPPQRLVSNAPCLRAARSLCSKLKLSICKILSSVFSSRNVSHKPRMSNLDDVFERRLVSSNFGFMWQILTLATCRPLCSECRRAYMQYRYRSN